MANRFELAHLAWPILVRAARRKPITYEKLASALGYTTPRVARFPLWTIQDFCEEKGYPPLTSLVVSKHTGRPGSGFVAWEGDLRDAYKQVRRFPWDSVKVPFGSRSRLTSTSVRQKKKSQKDFSVQDSEVLVNGRGPYQAEFRKTLLSVYGSRCAVCDTRHLELLIASHIVPWSQDVKNRLNPRNGILLCKTHDALFEAGILRIHIDLSIEIRELPRSKLGRSLQDFIDKHTQNRLRCPSALNRPEERFLGWRLKSTKAGAT